MPKDKTPPAPRRSLIELLDEVPGTGPVDCAAARLFDELEPEYRAAVDKAVERILSWRLNKGAKAGGGPSAGWLARSLREAGYRVTDQAVREHIGGRCSCKRAETE